MLQINMADVMNVLGSLTPYLIAIGVLFVLALIITFAVNRKTVKEIATRKIIHSESWIVALVGIVVAVSMMMSGPLSTLLNNATITKYELSDTTVSKANELAKEVQSEAITLLKNDDSNLPLSNKKVNVFGWGSTNPVYGGTGSGSMSKQYATTSLLDGMKEAGIETNSELSKLYTDYRSDRPEVGMWAQDWTLPEVPAKQYSDKLISDAKSFSDEAVITITRVGGEGADLPTNMKADGITYTNNSKDYEDFKDGESFLQLSQTERDMIDLVTKNFDKVTLVYNGANTFQFDFLSNYPQIKSVVWCPPAGQTGFSALGDVLAGKTNPSGKTSDTFLKDLATSVSYNNFGKFEYTNMADKAAKYKGFTGDDITAIPAFVNYSEGIYVGYKFYETAAAEGAIDYDSMVAFPFGYGLSYTSFEQKLNDVTYKDGKVTVDVTVTNTGDKAGKDVVEVYYNPPYTDGGIEKASTNLVAFEKTKELKPGASETVKVEFDDDDMASYDYKDAKAYVLEKGDYDISIQSDSHTVIADQKVTVDDTITYDSDSNTHSGDQAVATNQFDDVAGDVTYLSRANHFANYKEATAAPTNFEMSDKAKETFYNNSNYDPTKFDDDSDEMPTTGAKNGLKLADMYGKDYDDADWDKLLDQLTFDDGEMIGDMAHDMHVAGWYAPAMNIHRNAFSGRTFEYFSEDALLSGAIASNQIAGAKEKGVYSFMKHFAMNDQETKRTEMLCTWSNEQAMREIYLKPFEMSVKEGGAQAVMSAFNYIGNTYAGGDAALLKTVLRDEWGFKGFVLTDYFGGYGYQNADQEVRAGNDAMLATTKITNHITDKSATSVKAMRQAAHNILYTAANSWQYADGEPKVATPVWKTAMYVAWGVTAVLALALEALTIKRYMARRKTVATVEPDKAE